ncbi:MAG: hypothetical protein WBA74_00465, partial [Cyclobacteriaceae bacterium]
REAEKQKLKAEQNSREANKQQAKAIKAAFEAKLSEKKATAEEAKAKSAQERAENLRFQSIALSMAIKSKGIRDENLKGLVARQAYIFWRDYNQLNQAFSGDIYSGVYYALKELKNDSSNMLIGHENAVRSVVFDKDGDRLFSAGSDGKILKWNLIDETATVLFQNNNVSRVVGISPDERYLALGSDENDIFLFDLQRPNAEPKKIAGHGGSVFDLIFLPDNSGFVSVGADRTIRISDFNTSELFRNVKGRIKTLAIGPNGKYLAGGSEKGEVLLFDLEDREAEPILLHNDEINPVNAIVFSNSGDQIAFGKYNGNVLLWDLSGIEEFRFSQKGPVLTGFDGPVTDLKFSYDDKYLGATSTDKTARIWFMDQIFELPIVLDDHTDWVFTLDFHPSGNYLITGSKDKMIRKWPVKPDGMANEICDYLGRNMSPTEWTQYVGDDIPKEETCDE